MIITIIFVVLFILGLLLLDMFCFTYGALELTGALSAVMGGIGVIVCTICIVLAHVGVDVEIKNYDIQYESLVERRDLCESEYEDYSKSDVIKDIAEYNKEVNSMKYWGKNPFTSWFYSQRFIDSLKEVKIK